MSAIVLFEPCMPENLGNIVRTSVICRATIWIVGAVGFALSVKGYQRAAMRYGGIADIQFLRSLEDLYEHVDKIKSCYLYGFSSHANINISDVKLLPQDFLLFGSETKGLPEKHMDILKKKGSLLKIPMALAEQAEQNVCFNLANSVAVVLYEVWRQNRHY